MERYSDTYYVERIRQGDMAAFSCLIEKYSRPIHSLIFKLTRKREDTEELAQDVFMKVYRNLPAFKGACSFSTWIYRIAYNTAISELRKTKREYLAIEEAQIENVSEEDVAALMGRSGENEQVRMLELAIAKLPPDESALILLFYMEDKSVDEIVQISGLSASNVKTRLHRIRKKLLLIISDLKKIEYE
ncbi:MAG: sigma-70 family RNA polymerase sigma factor [Tannerellaceae bacterium]|jgi:RNA polymerase sigma-70 factor (ECF subfamily)|nr:sigma-70 family RNA polymerase sigma factor [Tannerellaceae bacterium]